MKLLTLMLAIGTFLVAADSSYGQLFRRGRSRPQAMQDRGTAVASQTTQEASKLIAFVREQQRHFVRPSFSETNCFTWIDLTELRAFVASKEAAKAIRDDPGFKTTVESLKQVTSAQRAGVYNSAIRIRRPTWREMGFIDAAGRGQTEAGQQGDILVGQQVVRLVREAIGD